MRPKPSRESPKRPSAPADSESEPEAQKMVRKSNEIMESMVCNPEPYFPAARQLQNHKIGVKLGMHFSEWHTELNPTMQKTFSKRKANYEAIKISHYSPSWKKTLSCPSQRTSQNQAIQLSLPIAGNTSRCGGAPSILSIICSNSYH